jgi:AcrR family transcriptional regulator
MRFRAGGLRAPSRDSRLRGRAPCGSRLAVAMSAESHPSARRRPQQQRSREIVEAILEAGRRLLAEGGVAALTTNRIAERAGVSVGSLYRYFPNKEAVVAAICDAATRSDVEEVRAALHTPLEEQPLREWLASLVDYQLERHRRLLELGSEVYRGQHEDFSLAGRMGAQEVERRIREVLERHRAELRVRDLDEAAFLVARGISAIVRRALQERPEKLESPAFREALVELLLRYAVE